MTTHASSSLLQESGEHVISNQNSWATIERFYEGRKHCFNIWVPSGTTERVSVPVSSTFYVNDNVVREILLIIVNSILSD